MDCLRKILSLIVLISITACFTNQVLACAKLVPPTAAQAQVAQSKSQENRTLKVLFIGNSYLYYNSAPEIFSAMAKEKFPNRKVITKLISDGGMTLARHYQEGRALSEIRSGNWDYVILQEQSELGSGVFVNNRKFFGKPDFFFEYAKKFNREIKKAGAKTLFLHTWAHRSVPSNQKYLNYAYSKISKELAATMIPAGLTWQFLNSTSDLKLFEKDGSHPSALGSYLVAASIFTTLFETSPIGLPSELNGHTLNAKGKRSLLESNLVSLDSDSASQIQRSVWRTFQTYDSRNSGLPLIQPKPDYVIPQLPNGDTLEIARLTGEWKGASRFDFVSDGLKLSFSNEDNRIGSRIYILRDGKEIKGKVVSLRLDNNQLSIKFQDETARERKLELVSNGQKLLGIITSTQGAYIKYDEIAFSQK